MEKAIKIYNSLSRKKEVFVPLKPPRVNMYTCGVTVYDESHIGHARSLYIFDVIRKYLKFRGYDIKFVRNITDIDDKIINRANEVKVNWNDLVNKYIDRYYEDLEALGIQKGDYEPRATENIADMIKHIQGLIDKGYAYVTNTGVYFNVRKFKDYGKLSGQGIDQMQSGARIEPDETKQDPLDFALWKKSKPDEPSWESPWGAGRPGWHIECSVMSQKFLKTETLDIHAGGRDLIFPHHENEIAQAQALTGKPFARYWIHHGLLTINGQKMSKSLGNFVTIKDFIAKYKNADLLKMFFLSAVYSQPIDFNEKKIKEMDEAHYRVFHLIGRIEKHITPDFQPLSKNFPEIESIKNKFIEAMDDDFNMPQALASLFDLVNIANKNINDLDFIFKARNLLLELSKILGLEFKEKIDTWQFVDSSDYSIESLVQKRNEARKKSDFKEADRIRKEIENRGYVLLDNKDGMTYFETVRLLEKDFEEIICKYPELIEEGLVLKGRQVNLYDRRMDILFEDKFHRELIIELKVGPIKDEHIGQLLSYEGMRLSGDNPDIRVMLVGNRVPPNIQKSLDHHGIAWKEITISQLKEFLSKKENKKFSGLSLANESLDRTKGKTINFSKLPEAKEGSSGVWIFQMNPKLYRFLDLIRDENFNKEWWHIDKKKKKIQKETKKGNIVLYWLSGSKVAGIYAMGEVVVAPKTITAEDCVIDYTTPEFKEKFPDENFSCPFFQCRLINEFIDKPILKEYLLDNLILKDMSIIKRPFEGANFIVTKEQWQELKRLYPILSDMV